MKPTIEELGQRLLEANAKIERLERVGSVMALLTGGVDVSEYQLAWNNLLKEFPAQSLALHNADVIDIACRHVLSNWEVHTAEESGFVGKHRQSFNKYADDLRNSVKEEG
jgi:hypothetical protein